jgi:hypothetical protein
MKNLLSENMLRFGTKNLSESTKRKLVFESIMQTINEHGLHNAVRRSLLTEQNPGLDAFNKSTPEMQKRVAGIMKMTVDQYRKYLIANPKLMESIPMQAFQLIKKGIYAVGHTDEALIQKGVYMLKTKADYDACLAIVKKSEGWPTIMRFIGTDMDYDADTGSDRDSAQGITQNDQLNDWSNHLEQFNSKEIPYGSSALD